MLGILDILGEISSSGGATLYKNPSDQTVRLQHFCDLEITCAKWTVMIVDAVFTLHTYLGMQCDFSIFVNAYTVSLNFFFVLLKIVTYMMNRGASRVRYFKFMIIWYFSYFLGRWGSNSKMNQDLEFFM